jgi:hypothetical protein
VTLAWLRDVAVRALSAEDDVVASAASRPARGGRLWIVRDSFVTLAWLRDVAVRAMVGSADRAAAVDRTGCPRTGMMELDTSIASIRMPL